MKNFFLTFACLLFATLSTVSQTYVVSREQLRDAIDPLNLRSNQLMTLATNGVILSYKAETGTNATDSVLSFNSTKRANYKWTIVNWDGDVRAFGSFNSSLSDVGDTINRANTNAVALGIPLLLPEGSFKVATWINLISGSHIKGKGMGKTILLRNSSSSSQTNTHVHATIQTPGVFNPYLTNGGHGATVTASVSDITLEDFSVSEASGSYSGFPVALMAAEDSTIQRVEVYGVTNHWAITLHGNRLKAVDNRIENTGRIYQDGIHFLGGQDSIISRNVIRSGDDAIAISSGGATDPNTKNILVSDNSLYSSHAHAIRVYQENASATNQFEGLRFVNNSGVGGLNRNGMIRIHSASTNQTYPLKDISISKGALQMGSFADHGSDIANGGFGAYVEDCSGLVMENLSFGPTIWDTLRIVDCQDVTLNDCSAIGATYSGFFNNTVRVENVLRLSVNGGDYRNVYGYGAQVFSLGNVTVARFSGAFLSNTVAGGAVVGSLSNAYAVAPGMISLVGNTIHSRSYAMLNSYFDPTNFVFVNNELVSPNLALFANGVSTPIPGHYVVEQNAGFNKGYFRTPRLQTTNSANMSQWFTDGSGYATMMGTNGLIKFAANELTTASSVNVRIAFQAVSNNLPMLGMMSLDDGNFPVLLSGWGSALNSSPRWHRFGVSGTNYVNGAEVMRLDLPSSAGDLPLRLRIAGSNDVYRVKVGAAGTGPGGAGRAVYID